MSQTIPRNLTSDVLLFRYDLKTDIDYDWRNVIFSYEEIVSNSNDSTALVYCMNDHRYDERFVRRIINKSEVYEHILANVMIPSARKRYPEGTLFFQQVNHPIHTANRIQRWFTRRRDVDPVDWPPNSPDMNPILNLWAAVKRILRSNWAEQPPVRTPKKLWDRVLDAWEEMAKNLDLFHNLVDSMPRRMRAVVDAVHMIFPCRYSASSYDERVMERRKFSPAPGFEPGFSALCADALSTKPHRIQLRRRLDLRRRLFRRIPAN
ncbi:hypothetical protein ANN_11017 [Periplaneta americana]|uniref:Tc1-like transposase DDE domain-containing protein n=1 Tax=Periplaneta americana TaxID=6978 RepID=A0ABQ8T592_PERAM|nr:hypothetical protein ANN_11017 [Periplaneta americana]